MKHTDLIKTALKTIEERGEQYGTVESNFSRISAIASAILNRQVTPYEIAMILHALKLARIGAAPEHADSYVDGISYLAFAGGFMIGDKPAALGEVTTGKDLADEF